MACVRRIIPLEAARLDALNGLATQISKLEQERYSILHHQATTKAPELFYTGAYPYKYEVIDGHLVITELG